MRRGFTLIELLVWVCIIGITATVIIAAVMTGSNDPKTQQNQPPTKQEQAQQTCIDNGGVPILNDWDMMRDCKFKPTPGSVGSLPPCNGSDLPYDIPASARRDILDARRNSCQ